VDTERTKRLPWILLGILMAGSAALIWSLTAGFTFVSDEWDLLLLRPGWSPDTLLEPFHEHIIIAPALVFKLLEEIFGLGSPRPMQVAAIGTFLATGLLLFIWMRPRVGDWAALIGAAIVLFLGAAFEDLLWAFQIGYFGSLACGIGALIALDRDDRRGDIAAAVLLVASLTFSSLGIPFALGALVEWLLNPRERPRRWFVPAAPLAFYALWWLGWGHDAESAVQLSNVPHLPKYVFDIASAGMTSMLGLATGDGSEPDQPHLIWGRLLLIALVAAAAWRLFRLGRVPRGVAVTAAVAFAFFALAALGQNELRPPTSSRYQLPSVVLILLVAAELLRGIRIPAPVLGAAAAVVVATSIGGVHLMKDQADARWKPSAVSNKISLGAIALAGDGAKPDFVLNLVSVDVPVDRFLDQVESSGSPGYSESELSGLDPAGRSQADQALFTAEGTELVGVDPGRANGECVTRKARAGVPVEVANTRAQLKIISATDSILQVGIARFADAPGIPVGSIYPRSYAWLTLPDDDVTLPWKITLGGPGSIRICG